MHHHAWLEFLTLTYAYLVDLFYSQKKRGEGLVLWHSENQILILKLL